LSTNNNLATRQNKTPKRLITQLTSSASDVINLTIALQLASQSYKIKTREKPSL
jgi:predicted DNA-binding ribbon-helix-helix protein